MKNYTDLICVNGHEVIHTWEDTCPTPNWPFSVECFEAARTNIM